MNDANHDPLTARRRKQILTALSLRPQHTATPGSLLAELEATGYPMTLTKLMVECAFLTNLGLTDAPDVGFITLTDDGLAVAKGLVHLPGIGAPALGER
ncbi:MAG: hypothetical protein LBS89_03520 [Zoogloeaceae bacterium]|jgi:hypothetical protein|nr:hypothetical protein [Zoogloeaceae bacterium]